MRTSRHSKRGISLVRWVRAQIDPIDYYTEWRLQKQEFAGPGAPKTIGQQFRRLTAVQDSCCDFRVQ